MSQRTSPTEAGDLNRRTEERKGRDTGSSVEFGKNIGRSEDLDANTKGGTMNQNQNRNKQQGSMENDNLGNESTRRSGGESGYGSSSGRTSGSRGNMGGSSDIGSSSNVGSTGSVGSKRENGRSSSSDDLDSERGRH